jgi:hypothetical protein
MDSGGFCQRSCASKLQGAFGKEVTVGDESVGNIPSFRLYCTWMSICSFFFEGGGMCSSSRRARHEGRDSCSLSEFFFFLEFFP